MVRIFPWCLSASVDQMSGWGIKMVMTGEETTSAFELVVVDSIIFMDLCHNP